MDPTNVRSLKWWPKAGGAPVTRLLVDGPCRLRGLYLDSSLGGSQVEIAFFDGTSASDPLKYRVQVGVGIWILRKVSWLIPGRGIRFGTSMFVQAPQTIVATSKVNQLTILYTGTPMPYLAD